MVASQQMSKFRTKVGKWTAVSLGDKNYDRGGGGGANKSSSIELLTLDSEFTRGQSNSFSSAGPGQWEQNGVQRWWTSVSKTKWKTGKLFCLVAIIAASALLALGIKQDRRYSSTDIKSL